MTKILLIDDDKISCIAIKSMLTEEGFQLEVCNSPEDAENAVVAYRPDLVLLDINMPGMSGFEVLTLIRSKLDSTKLPVLMLTSSEEDSDIVEAFSRGANDYLTKPINLPVAIARIQTQLDIVKLTQEKSRLSKIEAINAMIATYNHEINNPLQIAFGFLNKIPDEQPGKLRIKDALERIKQIVIKIRSTTNSTDVEYEDYTKSTKMLKISS